MSERPLRLTAYQVRAVLDGLKTQDRQPLTSPVWIGGPDDDPGGRAEYYNGVWIRKPCPYGRPGDRLWVQETWATSAAYDDSTPSQIDSGAAVRWIAGGERLNGPRSFGKVRASIQMPRWASRILLEVVAVRAQRLGSMSNEDLLREGVRSESCNVCVHAGGSGCEHCFVLLNPFRAQWDARYESGSYESGSYGWAADRWAWVADLRRVEP